MFEFITERIINSKTAPKAKWAVNANGDAFAFANDAFSVYGGLNYYKAGDKFVKSVKCSKRAYADPNPEKLVLPELSVDNLEAGDIVRLSIYLKQEGRMRSDVNDVWPIHIKPFIYEVCFEDGDDAQKLVKKLVDVVAKINGMSDIEYFSLTGVKKITLEAADCYFRFDHISIVKVGADMSKVGNILTGFEDVEPILSWKRDDPKAVGVLTKGSLGEGTVEYLLQNVRLATKANLYPFGINVDERPLPAGKYDQFLLEYTTEDREHGVGVVGQRSLSTTYHVFFVEQGASQDFENAIKQITDDNAVTPVVKP